VAIAASVSVTVPIWLTLMSAAFPTPRAIASAMMAGLVRPNGLVGLVCRLTG